jgi:hypothetical protein
VTKTDTVRDGFPGEVIFENTWENAFGWDEVTIFSLPHPFIWQYIAKSS